MSIQVEVDGDLVARLQRELGIASERELLERALRTLEELELGEDIKRTTTNDPPAPEQIRSQRDIMKLFGKINWDGDLEAMRIDHRPDMGLTASSSE